LLALLAEQLWETGDLALGQELASPPLWRSLSAMQKVKLRASKTEEMLKDFSQEMGCELQRVREYPCSSAFQGQSLHSGLEPTSRPSVLLMSWLLHLEFQMCEREWLAGIARTLNLHQHPEAL
jgi:hypothetical protein